MSQRQDDDLKQWSTDLEYYRTTFLSAGHGVGGACPFYQQATAILCLLLVTKCILQSA